MTINMDGTLFTLIFFQHHKPGKGNTVVRSKLKNVLTGAVLEKTWRAGEKIDEVRLEHRPVTYTLKTWRAGEKIDEVRLEHRPVTYTYADGHFYHFMDAKTYEDAPISEAVIGDDQLKYLKEGMECEGLVHGDKVIAVELPYFVTLEIVETDPGVRGDTATGGTKPAKLETGATVQVPLFLNEGDVIRVDRREDKYIERAK